MRFDKIFFLALGQNSWYFSPFLSGAFRFFARHGRDSYPMSRFLSWCSALCAFLRSCLHCKTAQLVKARLSNLSFAFMVLSLTFSASACGSSVDSVVQVSPDHIASQTEVSSLSQNSSPSDVVLITPSLLESKTILLHPDNYWIAWKDPDLGYIAASRSGVPVTVPNYPPENGGVSLVNLLHSVSLNESSELFTELFDPLGNGLAPSGEICQIPPSPSPSPSPPTNPSPSPSPFSSPSPTPPPSYCAPDEPRFPCLFCPTPNAPVDDCVWCAPDGQDCEAPPLPSGSFCGFDPLPDEVNPFQNDATSLNQTDSTSCQVSYCTGDPHLYTFDGVAYDFQAVGEFILARSLSHPFQLQSRMVPFGGQPVSVNAALTLQIGSKTIGFYTDRDPLIWINDQPFPYSFNAFAFPDGTALFFSAPNRYTVLSPTGELAQITDQESHLDLSLYIPTDQRGQVDGLLGLWDGNRSNEFTTRDGQSLPRYLSFEELYRDFGNSWRISGEDTLFNYRPDESPETFIDPNAPYGPVDACLLPVGEYEAAEAICRGAGVVEPVLQDCIVDVAIGQEPSAAQPFVGLEVPADLERVHPTEPLISGKYMAYRDLVRLGDAIVALKYDGNLLYLSLDGTGNLFDIPLPPDTDEIRAISAWHQDLFAVTQRQYSYDFKIQRWTPGGAWTELYAYSEDEGYDYDYDEDEEDDYYPSLLEEVDRIVAREDGVLLFSSSDLFRLDDLGDLKWIIGYEDITEAVLQARPDLNTLFRQQYDSYSAFSPDAVVGTAHELYALSDGLILRLELGYNSPALGEVSVLGFTRGAIDIALRQGTELVLYAQSYELIAVSPTGSQSVVADVGQRFFNETGLTAIEVGGSCGEAIVARDSCIRSLMQVERGMSLYDSENCSQLLRIPLPPL